MVARFQQFYCVQQTYRGFIAALSGEYWARLWTKVEGHRRSFIEARRIAEKYRETAGATEPPSDGIRERLAGMVANDKASVQFLDGPGQQ